MRPQHYERNSPASEALAGCPSVHHRKEGHLNRLSAGGGRGICRPGVWVWARAVGLTGSCWHTETGWKLGWRPQAGPPHGRGRARGLFRSLARHAGLLHASASPQVCLGDQSHLLCLRTSHQGKEAGWWQEESGRAQDAREGLHAAATPTQDTPCILPNPVLVSTKWARHCRGANV